MPLAFEIALAALVLAHRRVDRRRARDLRRGRRLRHLRAVAGARLGASRRPRCRPDRGRDRRRSDRHAAARRDGPPAGDRGRGRGGAARRVAAPGRRSVVRYRRRPDSPPGCCSCPIPRPRSRRRPPRTPRRPALGNPVTDVLMAFRAMDTLLEKIVLLLAIVGVWSLAPDRVWGGTPGRATRQIRRVPGLPGAAAAPAGDHRRHLHPLGRAPTIRAARSRAAPSSPPCGCWS